MKKLLRLMICGVLLAPIATLTVSANGEETIPEGFESAEQAKQTYDYQDPERVAARELKYDEAEKRLKERKSIYSISLPLREQLGKMWCGAAVGEMLIDYQLGPGNGWSQEAIAKEMGTNSTGAFITDQAAALRRITGLNFEVTRTSDYSFANALRTNINAYVGLSLPVNLYYIYGQSTGAIGHSLAAKGYSDANTVIFLDPWNYGSGRFGQHEVSITQMINALNGLSGVYIW